MLWDYNFRLVLAGTMLLGLSGGLVGTLMLLRRRSLVGDVASHAALPGILVAYLMQEAALPGKGKELSGLMLGAVISSSLGMLLVHWLPRTRRLRSDAALAITLSSFFGAGIVLLTLIQSAPSGSASGLTGFLFGQVASLNLNDLRWLLTLTGLVSLVTVVFLKELTLLCFDVELASVQGWPVTLLDLLLTALVIAVCVIGMQGVGLLLVVAMLVLPPTAARFWTDHLTRLLLLSALFGAVSCGLGTLLSASLPRLAAGPTIVLVAAGLFGISLLTGPRGLLARWWTQSQWLSIVQLEDLLRACFESIEAQRGSLPTSQTNLVDLAVELEDVRSRRGWRPHELDSLLRQAATRGLLRVTSDGQYCLTTAGAASAFAATRRHRLWEQYLIEHAEIPQNLVDRTADLTEHGLPGDAVDRLSELLAPSAAVGSMLPASPHALPTAESPREPSA